MKTPDARQPTFTIILPTFRHGRLIKNAFESILSQTRQDFEVFLVCDGAAQEGIDAAHKQARQDSRFKVREHVKGPGHGEPYRDLAIREGKGSIVCYHGDDDFWLPNHLEVMEEALKDADLAYSILLRIADDGYFNLGSDKPEQRLDNPQFRQLAMEDANLNWVAQLSVTAHRMSSYLSLPQGWTPRRPDVISYADMWLKFISLEDMKIKPVFRVTGAVLPSNLRRRGPFRHKKVLQSRYRETRKWMKLLRSTFLRGALDELCQLDVQPFQKDIELKYVSEKYVERRKNGRMHRVNGHIKDAARRYRDNHPSLRSNFQYQVAMMKIRLLGIR